MPRAPGLKIEQSNKSSSDVMSLFNSKRVFYFSNNVLQACEHDLFTGMLHPVVSMNQRPTFCAASGFELVSRGALMLFQSMDESSPAAADGVSMFRYPLKEFSSVIWPLGRKKIALTWLFLFVTPEAFTFSLGF